MSNRIRLGSLSAAALVLAACQDAASPTAVEPVPAPSAARGGVPGSAIPGQYIVVFRNGVADAPGLARRLAAANGGEVGYVYEHALQGFSVRIPDAAAAALARNPNVAYVEQDQVVSVNATQSNATWGLDRIDARSGRDGNYTYNATGAGVKVYIIDTGIRRSHNDFGGRAIVGYDAVTTGGDASDCDGHGTHVAGTVGGATWGVAKGATLVAVRVLDCNGSGTWSGVIAGMDWVTGDHQAGTPAAANLSLGGGASSTVDAAVQRMIDDGIATVVAAGNGDRFGRQVDACTVSPARVGDAMTIGATTQSDAKTSWSNYGNCVDWFAPGYQITSAWYSSNTATSTISGTSMAAPHVAGAAALYLQGNPGASALTVRNALYNLTTKSIVTSSSTTNNHLLYTGTIGGGTTPPPSNVAPTASFTYSCTELSCTFTDGSTDSDGTIASRNWEFGDGATSTATNPSRTYAAGGTYTVKLTVTDDDGAPSTTSKSVTVSETTSGGFSLSAIGYKVKGAWHADLTWSGATTTSVDVYRDGAKVATTANDGAYTDSTDRKGGGSYVYQVCEAGTTTCSAQVTVTF